MKNSINIKHIFKKNGKHMDFIENVYNNVKNFIKIMLIIYKK